MKKLTTAITIAIAFALSLSAQTVVPIGNDGTWHTDLILRNTTAVAITQPIGLLTYTAANGSTTTVTSTITIDGGVTKTIIDAGSGFDPGNRILPLVNGLDASVWLRFGSAAACTPTFEVSALSDPLFTTGDHRTFHRVRIDTVRSYGAFPTILNLDTAPHLITAVVHTPSTDFAESFNAPPGISQFSLFTQLPDGGDVDVYLGSPGLGGGVSYGAPTYIFLPTGPTNGGTQIIRYGVAP